jgi:hypothetical protein
MTNDNAQQAKQRENIKRRISHSVWSGIKLKIYQAMKTAVRLAAKMSFRPIAFSIHSACRKRIRVLSPSFERQ